VPRARKGSAKRASRNRLLKEAKGFRATRSALFTVAKPAVVRAERYATRDRKVKKREIRSLWITRVSAAARQRGVSYSRLMEALKKAQIALNRKMLAELALSDAKAFDSVMQVAGVSG
jgi:large subunit ribosomal protein L20